MTDEEMKPKVGLIAGAFDLIHPGYIRLFKSAKRVCTYLIIALQEDPSFERPLAKYKPVLSKEERLEILMAIRYVDEVRYYKTERDLIDMILELKPDVRILGDDYLPTKFLRKKITGKVGVPIYFVKRDHEWSNTRLVNLICERGAK